jgi:hypothetical protein
VRKNGGNSCLNKTLLVLSFRSFLMKADLGKAGQILLILRLQQQNHKQQNHNKQQHQARRAERTGPPYRIQNGFRQ